MQTCSQTGNGSKEARRWIDAVPERLRDEPEVYLWLGYIEIAEKDITKAIDLRKGLEKSGGSNPELNWRLAYTLLELNREAEADKLVKQLRRLVGSEQPSLRFLEAIQDVHAGRPAQSSGWNGSVTTSVARCREWYDWPSGGARKDRGIATKPRRPTR